MTELGVDMPILKLLGRSTIIELVTDAAHRLPVSLLPFIAVQVTHDTLPKEEILVPNGLGGLDVVTSTKTSKNSARVQSDTPESTFSPFTSRDYSLPSSITDGHFEIARQPKRTSNTPNNELYGDIDQPSGSPRFSLGEELDGVDGTGTPRSTSSEDVENDTEEPEVHRLEIDF